MKSRIIIATFVALFMVGSTAMAGDIGFKGVGVKLGYVTPSYWGSTIAFGGVVDLGKVIPQVALEAEVVYFSKSHDYGYYTYNYTQKFSEFSFGILGKYHFNKIGSGIIPYAGGGLGLRIWKWSYGEDVVAGLEASDSSTDLAIIGVGGVLYPFSPKMNGFAEFRYTTGSYSSWGIFAGVVFKMGK